jgi:2-polyprenyl-3-methyl-5-hydroxy-6-metoxy-1,4-benzoquinol methylase
MNTNPPSDATVAYYDTHADQYAAATSLLDMGELYERFLTLVPPEGHILDAGCGAGRDSLVFLRRGYQVTAFDASAKLAHLASERIGVPVRVLRFQDFADEGPFDGVWACASLLHVPRREIGDVFFRLTRALRPGGVWYMSFKAGDGETVHGGRFFNDYTEALLRGVIDEHPLLRVIDMWRTQDVRPERRGDVWTNALVVRASR